MSVAPLRINSKNSRLLYLHVWQILNKIVLFFDCSLSEASTGNISQFRKCLDCVLGVIVVPRNTIVAQESEQLVAISHESMSAFFRFIAVALKLSNLSVETIHIQLMFSQKTLFQTSLIYRIYDRLQQPSKFSYNRF